jgi:hypothetical protein
VDSNDGSKAARGSSSAVHLSDDTPMSNFNSNDFPEPNMASLQQGAECLFLYGASSEKYYSWLRTEPPPPQHEQDFMAFLQELDQRRRVGSNDVNDASVTDSSSSLVSRFQSTGAAKPGSSQTGKRKLSHEGLLLLLMLFFYCNSSEFFCR